MPNAIVFTVVVHACNIAPYAADMINTIKTQTYEPFNMFVLNGKSSDNSYCELDDAIAGDPRFPLIPLPLADWC